MYSKALMIDAIEEYCRMNKKFTGFIKDSTWEILKDRCDNYNIDLDAFKIKRKEKARFEKEWEKWIS